VWLLQAFDRAQGEDKYIKSLNPLYTAGKLSPFFSGTLPDAFVPVVRDTWERLSNLNGTC
jgi:hypothetical protein